MGEIKTIVFLLKRTFERDAWHGPSMMEVLRGIGPMDAVKRINGSHSILELVGHILAWRVFALKKLEGDEGYTVDDASNFPHPKDWEALLQDLETNQSQLLEALGKMDEVKLKEKVPGRPFNFSFMLHGLIHHDLYHLGQVQLIKQYQV